MKKLFMLFSLTIALMLGGAVVSPDNAYASRYIYLGSNSDYGDRYNHLIDMNTFSQSNYPEGRWYYVTVTKIAGPYGEGDCVGKLDFTFKEDRAVGTWSYRYKGFTGKGDEIPLSTWIPVSGSRLANDVLYAITHN